MVRILFIVCLYLFGVGGLAGWSWGMEDHVMGPSYSAKKIFMDFKEVSLTDILKIFSQQSNVNFVASPEVADKKITLYLNGVDFKNALKEILDANDLVYEIKGGSNIFIVKAKLKAEEENRITRVYQLKYATVSTSKLNSTISMAAMGPGSSSPSTTSSSASGLEAAVKASLSKIGQLMIDPRTNSLIVTDIPEQFEIIEKTIADLDVSVPQILIEVQVMDVSKGVVDDLGVKYGINLISFTGGAKAVNTPFSETRAQPSSSSSSSSSSTSSSIFTPGSFSATGMTAVLEFLTTSTDARTLARPRILTLNNETAKIEISTNQAVSIEQTSTSSTSSGTAITGNTVERVTTGVILKVTPQANLLTHEITLAISPKVINVLASSLGANIFDPETTGSDSILKLKDGQPMMIGGLMRTQDNNNISKLPILGDLPIIGKLFRYNHKSKSDRELIIFLTPHIIDEENLSALKPETRVSFQAAEGNQSAKVEQVAHRMVEVDQALNTYESTRN